MSEVDSSLLLVWKQPATRLRYSIGRLWRDGHGYHFAYEHHLPRSLDDALQNGFRLLECFPDPNSEWVDEHLFPIFVSRLPADWRVNDYARLGLDPTEHLGFLRLTGGRLPTDTLEFLEPVSEEGTTYSVRFPVAGVRYYQANSVIHQLHVGDPLRLELEADNPYDASAVKVLTQSGVMLGYVPSVYAWYIDDSVESKRYLASIDQIGPETDPQLCLIVHLQGEHEEPRAFQRIPKELDRYLAGLVPA